MSGGKKGNFVVVEIKRLIKIDGSRLDAAHALFHERDGRRRGKHAAMRADVIGVRVRNTAGLAVLARIQRENGIAETDGFVVREQMGVREKVGRCFFA